MRDCRWGFNMHAPTAGAACHQGALISLPLCSKRIVRACKGMCVCTGLQQLSFGIFLNRECPFLTPLACPVCILLPMQERIRGVRSLFRDAAQTEFVIATIPTQLGIAESRRLLAALQEETIPCKRIIVNQVCLCVSGGSKPVF